MKIKILILSIVVALITFNSCVDDILFGDKFLEKAPGGDISQDTIFGKAEYARQFLWENYGRLYYGLPTSWSNVGGKMNMGVFEALSDCWHSHLSWDGVNRMYYTGAYNAGLEDSGGDGHTRYTFLTENSWEAIRAGWLFIENVDRVPDMSAEEKARLKAESKVIIASRYFDMFRHFGGLPLVNHAFEYSSDVSSYFTERATIEATTDFMTNLLDEAATDLPWALEESEIANWDGRFTRAAAMGLKCKILLFAASPLFNDNVPYSTEPPQTAVDKLQVWTGSYKVELWNKCLKACEDFFAEVNAKGRYELLQASGTTQAAYRAAYRDAYYSRGSGGSNPEMLISTRVRYTYGSDWDGNYYFPQSCMYGAFTPTQEFVEMFPMGDGTPFDWNNPDHVKKIFSDRDPRLFETILVNNAEFQGRQAELWIGGREAQKDPVLESGQYAPGYANYKYILDFNSSRNKPTLWPYLRIAEVHLIYAEALMKANRLDDAIAEVDKVRARVGLKGLVVSNPAKNMNDPNVLLKEILRERACELGLEDVRFFDMIRHKLADDFKKPLHGLRIRRADGLEESWSDKGLPANTRPTEFTYEIFQLSNVSRAWWTNFSPKWYLTAFPPKEINKDYGLTQNPGW